MDNLNVTRVQCGGIVKFTLTTASHYGATYTRIPNTDYYIDKCGYLQKMNRSEVKGDNIDSLKRSFARLRDIINANAVDPECVLFLTFTYDARRLGCAPDLKRVYRDMDNTFRRIRSDYSFEYVYVVEQQGNGNWHVHALLFFPFPAPYIPQEKLDGCYKPDKPKEELQGAYWQRGFARISKRFSKDEVLNIGAYICADLTFGEGKDEHGRIKNERLLSYPSGVRLVRASRGIVKPVRETVDYFDYLRETSDKQPFYSDSKVMEFGSTFDYYKWEHYRI